MFKDELLESMQAAVSTEAGYLTEGLDDDSEVDTDDIVAVQSACLARGGQYEYEDGVFDTEFEHWQSVEDFCSDLDNIDGVESYEIMVFHRDNDKTERVDIDVDDIVDDSKYSFTVLVYLSAGSVVYYDEEDIEDDVELDEVKRRIKVDSKGKRRIKMQCRPGFKWDGSACVKITGAELAISRKAKRRMVISKKSQGSALKIRVTRKIKKANRFRKAMGLN